MVIPCFGLRGGLSADFFLNPLLLRLYTAFRIHRSPFPIERVVIMLPNQGAMV